MGSRIILNDIHRLCALEPAQERIRENLNLGDADVVEYCKGMLSREDCRIMGKGENILCMIGNIIISVNSATHMIISAHKL
ncbi:DUF3781 domain-containing protein [Ruminococcus sp. FC2018]|uniref:DUF3781 domain-containing protein n=1 Tax=Ruminococcus sp. FC2018 TaxID=1410617 RepID=UPI000490DAFF|nr:DUF3781 domain-containing protein [Ruminococcus sp. FC2018]